MSEIFVLKIKNKMFSFKKIHLSEINNFLQTTSDKWIDSGYLIIDFDNKIVINCQTAVDIRKKIKNMEVFEV